MNLHEQARAEAEKRWPVGMYHVWGGNLPISSEMFGGIARDSFKDGFLAGHEAATRTRVVTTVTELDALPDRTCIIDADMELHQRHGTLLDRTIESAWLGLLPPTLSASSEVRLPARVLYEPEETR